MGLHKTLALLITDRLEKYRSRSDETAVNPRTTAIPLARPVCIACSYSFDVQRSKTETSRKAGTALAPRAVNGRNQVVNNAAFKNISRDRRGSSQPAIYGRVAVNHARMQHKLRKCFVIDGRRINRGGTASDIGWLYSGDFARRIERCLFSLALGRLD